MWISCKKTCAFWLMLSQYKLLNKSFAWAPVTSGQLGYNQSFVHFMWLKLVLHEICALRRLGCDNIILWTVGTDVFILQKDMILTMISLLGSFLLRPFTYCKSFKQFFWNTVSHRFYKELDDLVISEYHDIHLQIWFDSIGVSQYDYHDSQFIVAP